MSVKKKLVSVLLTVGLLFSLIPLSVITAESTLADEADQPPVVTELYWSDNFLYANWKMVDSDRYYKLELYKDGELYATRYTGAETFPGEDTNFYPFHHQISESGSYQFRIAASCELYDPNDPVKMNNPDFAWGNFSELSPKLYYQRPSQELGTTVGYWDQETAGLFHFAGVEGANTYLITLYQMLDDGTFTHRLGWNSDFSSDTGDTEGTIHDVDLTNLRNGKYCVTVTAWSDYTNKIADGKEGDKSEIFDSPSTGNTTTTTTTTTDDAATSADTTATTETDAATSADTTATTETDAASSADTATTAETDAGTSSAANATSTDTAVTVAVTAVNNVLDAALKDSNVDSAKVLSALTTQVTKEQLQIAMQTDETARNNVKTLEDKYAQDQNITVEAPSISTDAQKQVNGTISMIGAALNANANETVQLLLAVPSTLEQVNTSLYKNSVQLDLSLLVGGVEKSELDVPVTITVPIPTGVEKDNLVILHYHDGNEPETLATSVDGDTVTFTVTGFSTFVFANTVNEATLSPKTGDTGIWMFMVALVAGMGAVAYGTCRFRKAR